MFASPETQKAYELSYATFRVAALVRKPDLKERLERQAAAILEQAASGSTALTAGGELEIHDNLEALRALIMLAEGVAEIRYVNARVLLRELGNLERMLKEKADTKEEKVEFDIEKMFSMLPAGQAGVEDTIRRVQERRMAEEKESAPDIRLVSNVDSAHPSPNGFGGQAIPTNAATNPEKQETRQSGNGSTKLTTNGSGNSEAHPSPNGFGGQARALAVFASIEKGSKSIKDLLAEFGSTSSPLGSVSERTLRYDLQRLVEQGKIVRVGSGGPGTYYRLPAIAEAGAHPSP